MIRPTETGQLITDDGRLVTAGDMEPPRGEHSGVVIYTPEVAPMAKADKNGVYRLGKTYIKVRAGDVIPVGAEPIEEPKAEARKLDAAPENKARAAAPETKSKKAE